MKTMKRKEKSFLYSPPILTLRLKVVVIHAKMYRLRMQKIFLENFF